MLESTINLIKASINDAELIEKLAIEIWNDYYPDIITKDQIDYMLGKMYNRSSLEEQLALEKTTYFLIYINNEPQGFIGLLEEEEEVYFLSKFYILQTNAAKGKGTRAFKQLLSIIQPKKITLTVNRQNYKSINFYFKNGFTIDKVADFDIGNGFVMNDFVMSWIKYN